MTIGEKAFVFITFAILAISFVSLSGVLILEYSHEFAWLHIALLYPHYFIYLPIFGILALVASYVPATVLVNMYWHHLPMGRVRFILGYATILILSHLLAHTLMDTERAAIWQVNPKALVADKGEPPDCETLHGQCQRVRVLQSLQALRAISQKHDNFSNLVPICTKDEFYRVDPEPVVMRFCFAASLQEGRPQLYTDPVCCQAKARLNKLILNRSLSSEQESLTYRLWRFLLPMHIFFFLALFLIAILLAFRARRLQHIYIHLHDRVYVGILITIAALIMWPVMASTSIFAQEALVIDAEQAAQAKTIVRAFTAGIVALVSVFAVFLARISKNTVRAFIEAVIPSVSTIGATQFGNINNFLTKVVGIGMPIYLLLYLLGIAVIAIAYLIAAKRTSQAD